MAFKEALIISLGPENEGEHEQYVNTWILIGLYFNDKKHIQLVSWFLVLGKTHLYRYQLNDSNILGNTDHTVNQTKYVNRDWDQTRMK